MEEKIKVNLPQSVIQSLDKDAYNFAFVKKDGSKNRNAFINTLILSYYEEFSLKEEQRYKIVSNELSKWKDVSAELKKDISKTIAIKLDAFYLKGKKELYSEALAFKPTKESSKTIQEIQASLPKGTSLSDYFRRLFTSYTHLMADQREAIIFKSVYQYLNKAILEHKRAYIEFGLTDTGQPIKIQPFALFTPLEETHIYVLGTDYEDQIVFYRLSTISKVMVIYEDSIFPHEVYLQLKKFQDNDPRLLDNIHSVRTEIVLTEKGVKMFNKNYIYRPIPDSINGNTYVFSCSQEQLFKYFCNFGSEARVICPLDLKNRLRDYFSEALQIYAY